MQGFYVKKNNYYLDSIIRRKTKTSTQDQTKPFLSKEPSGPSGASTSLSVKTSLDEFFKKFASRLVQWREKCPNAYARFHMVLDFSPFIIVSVLQGSPYHPVDILGWSTTAAMFCLGWQSNNANEFKDLQHAFTMEMNLGPARDFTHNFDNVGGKLRRKLRQVQVRAYPFNDF